METYFTLLMHMLARAGRRLRMFILVVLGGLLAGPVRAASNPVHVTLGQTAFILPLQMVGATQLYSFDDGKGYPGVETVLVERKQIQLTFGAAPVLGTSANVPFLGLQARLPEKFFDTANNSLWFGAWVGQASNSKRVSWGLKATVPLW